MLIDSFLEALRAHAAAEELMASDRLDEIERELAARHLRATKSALQDALDDYIDRRVRQRLVELELERM